MYFKSVLLDNFLLETKKILKINLFAMKLHNHYYNGFDQHHHYHNHHYSIPLRQRNFELKAAKLPKRKLD